MGRILRLSRVRARAWVLGHAYLLAFLSLGIFIKRIIIKKPQCMARIQVYIMHIYSNTQGISLIPEQLRGL